jgi:hypothetical protein
VVILIAPLFALLGSAQSLSPGQTSGRVSPRVHDPFEDSPDGNDPVYASKRMNALNADRHKSMVSDAEKLLRLARELDAEVTANTSEELTPKERKEVAEIEKLARNVKEKMARSFAGGPVLHDPMIPVAQ